MEPQSLDSCWSRWKWCLDKHCICRRTKLHSELGQWLYDTPWLACSSAAKQMCGCHWDMHIHLLHQLGGPITSHIINPWHIICHNPSGWMSKWVLLAAKNTKVLAAPLLLENTCQSFCATCPSVISFIHTMSTRKTSRQFLPVFHWFGFSLLLLIFKNVFKLNWHSRWKQLILTCGYTSME